MAYEPRGGGKRAPSGLSRKEYMKRYREEHKEKALAYARSYLPAYFEENANRYIFYQLKNRVKSKGLEFNLDLSDIKIPENCPILNIPLRRNVGHKGASPNSPSVDRINNDKGYIKGNIQVISTKANIMKSSASVEELQRFADWVIKAYPR